MNYLKLKIMNHRIAEAGRYVWRWYSPKTLFKAGLARASYSKAVYSQGLNFSKDRDSTNSLCLWFQCLNTPTVKCAFCCLNGIAVMFALVMYLYTFLKYLFFRVHRPSLFSDIKCSNPLIILMAFCWNCSSVSFHTVGAKHGWATEVWLHQ